MGVTFVDVTVIGPTGIEITLKCFIIKQRESLNGLCTYD